MSASTVLPEGHYATTAAGLRVHYHDTGGDGRPVVFLHGSGPGASGWSNFQGNVPAFGDAGYRVLVPDLIGFGFTDKPTDRPYHLDRFVDALLGWLDALGVERCSLVGNSLGGAIAIAAALRARERVERLVLMAPGGIEEREAYFEMEGIVKMFELFASGGLDTDTMRSLLTLQLHDPAHVTDQLVAERLSIVPLQPKEVLTTMEVPNMEGRLGELTMPVLAFWGMDDRFCPRSGAEKIVTRCPDARMLLLTRCGHWVMVEHAALFNRTCVDFLDGTLD